MKTKERKQKAMTGIKGIGGGDARDEIIRGQADERMEEHENEKRRKDHIMQKEDIKKWKEPESRIK